MMNNKLPDLRDTADHFIARDADCLPGNIGPGNIAPENIAICCPQLILFPS